MTIWNGLHLHRQWIASGFYLNIKTWPEVMWHNVTIANGTNWHDNIKWHYMEWLFMTWLMAWFSQFNKWFFGGFEWTFQLWSSYIRNTFRNLDNNHILTRIPFYFTFFNLASHDIIKWENELNIFILNLFKL